MMAPVACYPQVPCRSLDDVLRAEFAVQTPFHLVKSFARMTLPIPLYAQISSHLLPSIITISDSLLLTAKRL